MEEREARQEVDRKHAANVAIEAARDAGDILRRMLDRVQVREKSTNDLVTDADLAAQHAIESVLMSRFPGHGFLGEEGTPNARPMNSLWQWVVDPLDGTTNYAHGLRSFCVSIALMYRRLPVVGVIFDPMADELFWAIAGQGAFVRQAGQPTGSERRLAPSDCQTLQKALVAVSFPPRLNRNSLEIQHFLEILLHSQSVRRLGSAALNLCYVAAGRLDAYFGSNLKVWDVAAAALIAEEAGVRLARFDGGPFDPWTGEIAAAANSSLLGALVEKLGIPESRSEQPP